MPTRPYQRGEARKKARSANQIAGDVLAKYRRGEHEGFVQAGNGSTYQYNGRYWEMVSDDTLRAIVMEHDDLERTKSARRKESVDYIKAFCHRRDLSFGRVADWEVPCANGVVDVRSGDLRPHRPEDYLDSVIPWAWDGAAVCDDWEKALLTWFDDEEDRPRALREFLGYIVLPHARFKKALILFGPGDTGKSLFAQVAKLMVGDEFACSLPVSDMDDPVKRSVIKHKRLNVITELSADAMIADGGFKTLVSTEEPVLINPKYVAPHTIVPTAKHIIATNTLPRVNDRTEATYNRLLIVKFDRVLGPGEKDEELLGKIKAGMTGVLRWAIEGARALIEAKGQFSPLHSAESILREMREQSNPVELFIKEKMTIADGTGVPLSEIAERFNKWQQGRKVTPVSVGKLLRAAGLRTGDVYVGTQSCPKGLIGWRWLSDLELQGERKAAPP